MAIAPLEAWEVGLDQAFTEQQQGLIFEKLGQQSKPGHLVVAEIWSSLHHASAEKLKGAIGVHVPELRAGPPVQIFSLMGFSIEKLSRCTHSSSCLDIESHQPLLLSTQTRL